MITNETIRNAVILIGSTMSVMAGASIAPALPEMSKYFADVDNAEFLVRIMLTVPSLFIALFSPIAGVIFDKYGRKIPLVMATILYGVAGISGFFLDNIYLILIGRAFLGVSVAFIMAGYITVLGDLFSGEKLDKMMGAQAAFMSFGGVMFLAVSGSLADIEWRHPFLIYLFAFIVLPGLVLFLKETGGSRIGDIKKDVNKIAIFSKEIFQKTKLVYAVAFAGMALFLMIPVQLPFLLKQSSAISNTNIGLLMSLWILFSALTSLFYKNIRKKLSFYSIFGLAFLLWSIGYTALSFHNSIFLIIVALALSGIGNGLVLPNTKVLLITLISPEYRGRAVGILTMAFYFGQFSSPFLFEIVITGGLIENGFAIFARIMFLMSILYFYAATRKKKEHSG